MDKNKKIIIVSSISAVVIILLVIVFFIFSAKSVSNNNQANQNAPTSDNSQILSLSASDIGLSLANIASGKFAGHGVEMVISKLSGITAIDYELSYTSTGNIPRGAIGHIDVKSTDTTIDQQLPFGTCSDVCHFDSGVTNIKLTLKVTKTDGKIYSVEQSFNP